MSKIVQENASQKKKKEILNRWTKYCSELYKASGGPSELNCPQTDIESMITTFNTAVTETASEIFGKHRQKKKPWITAEILDLCDKRRAEKEKI